MTGGVWPEICLALYKYGIIKILILCCILLDFSLRILDDIYITNVHYTAVKICLQTLTSEIIKICLQILASEITNTFFADINQ
jgi:hypothetical protein